jgi:3-oxoacyl-[acyl-carrier-protein] synthase III
MQLRVGLLGVATYLPPDIRRNDWWPRATVERWQRERPPSPPLPDERTAGMQRVLEAMAAQDSDPFRGVVERRVMSGEMTAVDMEAQAAERAIASAGVERREIDVLLTHSAVPDDLATNGACALHRRLGLAPECFTMQAEASGNSFLMQLTLAEQMIAGRRARHALLVQSSAASRLVDREDPFSPLLGDGAAAVVVGPAVGDPPGGVLAAVHRTNGSSSRALIAGVPGGRWYDGGRIVLHRADPAAAHRLFLETADRAVEVVTAALDEAGHTADDVDFLAIHQGTPWLRQVTQGALGMTRARSVDTFATTGYLFSASIPLVLETAQRQAMVQRGDLVVMHGGGVGSTYSAIVLRWGAGVA